jgi:hypothetical protein
MLSDCSKCWDTPCTCGWDYKGYTIEGLSSHLASITQYRDKEDALKALELAISKVKNNTKFNEK